MNSKFCLIAIAVVGLMFLSMPVKAELFSFHKSVDLMIFCAAGQKDTAFKATNGVLLGAGECGSPGGGMWIMDSSYLGYPGNFFTGGQDSWIDLGAVYNITAVDLHYYGNAGNQPTRVYASNTTSTTGYSLIASFNSPVAASWSNHTIPATSYRYFRFETDTDNLLQVIDEIEILGNPLPNITSWGNTKTNNQDLDVYLHPQEGANFNVTANQAITTYTWKLDNVDQSNNWNNISIAYLGLGNHTLNVTTTNTNGSDYKNWTINSSYANSPTSGYDPSGYVLNGTTATCCGIPGAYVNISNTSYVTSTYSDSTGFWNVNIGADGNYDYLVSAPGYTTLTGNQAFTIGGVNTNFTMTASGVGLLKGTVYTYATNVPSTKVVDGSLTDLQHIDENSDTIVGQYKKFNFSHDGYTGYAIRISDVSSSGGRSAIVNVYHMDNSAGFQTVRNDLPPVGDSPYVMFEGDTVTIPVHASAFFDANIYMHVNNIFIGSEQSKVEGNFGMLTTLTGLGQVVRVVDYIISLFLVDPTFDQALVTYDPNYLFGSHDDDNPIVVEIDTTKCKTTSVTDGACILASNFNPGASYLSFQASITGQSNEAGFPGKVIFGFSDDAATQFPDANQQDVTLDSSMSLHSSNVINMSSVDVDGDNQIKVWLKIPSGYADTIAIKYFYVTFIGGQTPLVPLPGVQVNVYNRTTNALVASTITSSPMGTYSKYVPLGNVSVTYSKNNYFPNTTWLNFTGSANVITNNVILNSTNTTVNQSFDQVYVLPDPSTYTQQINAYFTTLDETCLGFGYILEVRQHGTDLVLQTVTIPRLTTGTTPLNTFNPGTYDIVMKGYKTCPTLSRDIVAQNNFTVTTNVPTVHWSSSKYVLGQTMQIQIGVPVGAGAQNVTVIYPNGTQAFNQNFAESNTFYTQTFATNSNRTLNNYPPGLYIANISGGNTAQTYLSNVSTDDYSLSAPDSVGYGQVFNVVYVSPESADLVFSNSDGTYIASVPNVIGNNIVQFDTGLLPKRDTVLTIKIVRDDQIKASVTTSVSISFPGSPDNIDAVAVIDGWTALFNLGINPTSKFLFALIITVIFMLAGALVTRNLGWGTLFGIIPFVFFAFIGYIPLLLSVLIVIAIGLKLRFL